MTPTRVVRVVVAALAAALVLAGCGARVEQAPPPAGGPVTVTNCGVEVTYPAPPQRVVTNDINMAEMMFALGLGNRMAGYVLDDGQNGGVASSPWRAEFERLPRLSDELTVEVARAADADLVFAGWNYGFNEAQGVTPETMATVGIPSYLLTESCRNGLGRARGIMPPLDALYTDLTNLGAIFGVPDRAAALVAQYRRTVDEAAAMVPPGPRPRVFLYDGGIDQPFTSGRHAGPQDVITRAGGENIFGDLDDSWTTVGWEPVTQRDPEVVLINDYGGGEPVTVAEKETLLRTFGPTATTTAVREERFFVLPYAALVSGPRNPQAIADFAAYLRSR
ncbi:MAG TPA: ABC transporter substrate-binding protein [Actinomycetospora sp.]|nr:ABC transporter substrate-binding protein [Actinomycetospora sp.]